MIIWTSVFWNMKIQLAKKWPEMGLNGHLSSQIHFWSEFSLNLAGLNLLLFISHFVLEGSVLNFSSASKLLSFSKGGKFESFKGFPFQHRCFFYCFFFYYYRFTRNQQQPWSLVQQSYNLQGFLSWRFLIPLWNTVHSLPKVTSELEPSSEE